jgi:hypothetical protein
MTRFFLSAAFDALPVPFFSRERSHNSIWLCDDMHSGSSGKENAVTDDSVRQATAANTPA